jgi:hypothetical protein
MELLLLKIKETEKPVRCSSGHEAVFKSSKKKRFPVTRAAL